MVLDELRFEYRYRFPTTEFRKRGGNKGLDFGGCTRKLGMYGAGMDWMVEYGLGGKGWGVIDGEKDVTGGR